MATRRFGLIMHGVTGRMGYNQHLVRSIVAIRAEGGVELANGDRLMPDPILVGRNAAKVEEVARRHGIERWGDDLDAALANPEDTLFFDAGTTQMRAGLLSPGDRRRQARLLREADLGPAGGRGGAGAEGEGGGGEERGGAGQAVPAGARGSSPCCAMPGSSGGCSRSGASSATGCSRATGSRRSGRRGTTGAKDGGGIILDMLCHWRYVLDNLFGEVKAVSCLGATHIPERVDERGKAYAADADDAAYATFELDGRGDRADQLVLGDAGAARRPGDLPGGRDARVGDGGAARSAGRSTG